MVTEKEQHSLRGIQSYIVTVNVIGTLFNMLAIGILYLIRVFSRIKIQLKIYILNLIITGNSILYDSSYRSVMASRRASSRSIGKRLFPFHDRKRSASYLARTVRNYVIVRFFI